MKINIGCGFEKINGYKTLDISKECNPDFVHDLNKFPYPFDNESIEKIRMFQVLEHLDDIINVIKECRRILKKGGILEIKVPNARKNNDAFLCNHKHLFSKTSFKIFYDNDPRHASYPKFTLEKLKSGSDIWIILKK